MEQRDRRLTPLGALSGAAAAATAPVPDTAGFLAVEDLTVEYAGTEVVHGISFGVRTGERLCLLGPSGCGKTTTLQVIAGFLSPAGGRVSIVGQEMTGISPEHRNIGIVFQNYALFPHLSVYENIAFGLRMRKVAERAIKERVGSVLQLVRLPNVASKRPNQLSGGEQQRIAFARAVVIKPRLLLLDEPFSNLDARLRHELRAETLELLQQLNISTILVTHDQEEAMYIADRIAVMRSGHIEQIGTGPEIYHRPVSLFVARFVGESNVLDGHVRQVAGVSVVVDVPCIGVLVGTSLARLLPDEPVKVLIRPESLRVAASSTASAVNRWTARLERVLPLGARTEVHARVQEHRLVAWQLAGKWQGGGPDSTVELEVDQSDTLVFPAN